MLLYTHVITALKIKSLLSLNIKNPHAYLLGAVLPDVRYIAGLPREATHLEASSLFRLAKENHIEGMDIITGYLVHLLADELNEKKIAHLMFPKLPVFCRNYFPIGIQSIIMEIYYQTEKAEIPKVSEDAGELGEALGIPRKSVSELAFRTNAYIKNPSLEQGIKSIAGSNLESNRNIQFYVKIGEFVHRTKPIRKYVLNNVSNIREPFEALLAESLSQHFKKLGIH